MEAERATIRHIVERFAGPGPRYTSYPTAPEWNDPCDENHLRQRLSRDRKSQRALSLYLHIPFCREICHFCACNTYRAPDPARHQSYVDALCQELTIIASLVGASRPLCQIHFGGGTPTFLTCEQLQQIWQTIQAHYTIAADSHEIAMELDPRVTSLEHLDLLSNLGFNRLSLGVQDFDPQVQRAVNRIQPQELSEEFYRDCRQRGFASMNLDLMYGLPLQSEASFARTVASVINLRPDRIALFGYAHVPWLKAYQRRIETTQLPDAELRLNLFLDARQALVDAGYVPIGLDHFALPDDELAKARTTHSLRRNFQGYTVLPASDVIAFGITGISDFGDLYLQNEKKFKPYFEKIGQQRSSVAKGKILSDDDRLRRHVIEAIMCNGYVHFATLEEQFQVDVQHYFADAFKALQPMCDQELVELDAERLQVTSHGQLVLRNIAMCFDAYLKKQPMQVEAPAKPRFSQTL